MIIAGLEFPVSGVAAELHKIRLDRDVAAIGCSLLPNAAGILGQGARRGWRGVEARLASGLVRGAACAERLGARLNAGNSARPCQQEKSGNVDISRRRATTPRTGEDSPFRVITHSRRGVFCGLDDFADACEAGRRHERIAFSKRPLRELSLPATTMTPDWRWKKLALREDDAPLSSSRGSADILISRKFFADFRREAGQVLLRVGRRLAFSAMPW